MSTSLASTVARKSNSIRRLVSDSKSPEQDAKTAKLVDDELRARKTAKHGAFYLTSVNGIAALVIFVFYLISLESLLSIFLSVGLTIYTYKTTEDNESFDGNVMNWVLLSFAVITPLSSSISMAFSRRDRALDLIASLRSTFIELYEAHSVWDWGYKPGQPNDTGKQKSKVDWLDHADTTAEEIRGICNELTRYLTLPTWTRARHRFLPLGRREAVGTEEIASRLNEMIMLRFGRLADLCEILKREGLPPNEATRIRQWERMLLESIERLIMIKKYRTPQALRSFSRLFSILLPPFYAPFYSQMARELNSLGMGIVFAIITSIALTALFEAMYQMEDPFVLPSVLDGIHVKTELIDELAPRLNCLRMHFFPDAIDVNSTRPETQEPEQEPIPPPRLVSGE